VLPAGRYLPESPCPVCGLKEATVASRQSRRGDLLITVSCDSCGLFRNDPLPTSEELRRFHEVDYRESYKGVRAPKARTMSTGRRGQPRIASNRSEGGCRRAFRICSARRTHST